MDIVLTR